MKRFMTYVLQDWEVNQEGNAKSRLVPLLFRSAHILGQLPAPFAVVSAVWRGLYAFIVEWVLGIELPWDTQIGPNLKLLHGVGLVVNRETMIGANCTLRQSTTIGNKQRSDGSFTGSPKIGNHVDIGANVVILGAVTIGDHAVIGAGAVVVKDVPAGAVVAGNPARILRLASDLNHSLDRTLNHELNHEVNHDSESTLMIEA